MPILENFAVKHIRPITEAGYNAFCDKQMIDFLTSLNFSYDDIVAIFAEWRVTALSDPHANSNLFVAAAQTVSQARWEELYKTDESTIMFLNDTQLASLSNLTPGPNKPFAWNSPTSLAICVTIKRASTATHIYWGAKGCTGATDGNGMISHFTGLLP